ncbi:MAG: GAF domain-containing sensor histidine kinase [Candidatus Nanopelagicales bacterium]|nr:GAF domain-containing sensor histidine kinase [Candidatus Nanopelagicales bacterium]MDZ4250133.1 GAF domain-containing sensor histidine kinase [Candidatus Nanopelagicales bacterium]
MVLKRLGGCLMVASAATGQSEMRRLKLIAMVLPLGFLVVLELAVVNYAADSFLSDLIRTPVLWLLVGVSFIPALAFGYGIFHSVDKIQRRIVEQNQELAALSDLSNAIQGVHSLPALADAASECVREASGAREVLISVEPTAEGHVCDGIEQLAWKSEHGDAPGALWPAADEATVVDIPLIAGLTTVGRMRVVLDPLGSPLTVDTIHRLGHLIAEAIQANQILADLRRRQREGHALYDVLVQISRQVAPPDILAAVVHDARELINCDEAALSVADLDSLTVRAGDVIQLYQAFEDAAACITSRDDQFHDVHQGNVVCPIRASSEWRTTLTVPIQARGCTIGDIWIARRADEPFSSKDGRFLETLSGLAAIALTSASSREQERQEAIIDERNRIAREMHDSLAQILGACQLRLRALQSRPGVAELDSVFSELTDLADLCGEGYRDVREAILGLRDSGRADWGLLDGLRDYLSDFSRNTGMSTSLECAIDLDPLLTPRCEVQVIRVIQEALTNVRKHSAGRSVTVRVRETQFATVFEVEDDGSGFELRSDRSHRETFGLSTMTERMSLIGGTLTVDAARGRGTRIIAEIPRSQGPHWVTTNGSSGGFEENDATHRWANAHSAR